MDEAGRRAWLQSLAEDAEAVMAGAAITPAAEEALGSIEATLATWPAATSPSEGAVVAWLRAAHAVLHHGHDGYKYQLAVAALKQALAEQARS